MPTKYEPKTFYRTDKYLRDCSLVIYQAEELGNRSYAEQRVHALAEQCVGVGVGIGNVIPAVLRRQNKLNNISKKC